MQEWHVKTGMSLAVKDLHPALPHGCQTIWHHYKVTCKRKARKRWFADWAPGQRIAVPLLAHASLKRSALFTKISKRSTKLSTVVGIPFKYLQLSQTLETQGNVEHSIPLDLKFLPSHLQSNVEVSERQSLYRCLHFQVHQLNV